MVTNIYPSRGLEPAYLIPRTDPVVHADSSDKAPISSELIDRYQRDGFLVLDNVFDESELAVFQNELERLNKDEAVKQSPESITEPTSGDIRSVFRIHQNNPVFKDLVRDPRLLHLARYILADDVYIHQSRINYKPGFRGKEFYWHSDFETWHMEDGMPRMRALSISIALTDNYDHNGALLLIPGSQNQYVSCQGQTPEDNFKQSLKKQEVGVPSDDMLTQLAQEGGIHTATGKAGSIVVFDCNTMHGSNGNITPYPRSNLFFVYNALSNRVVEPYSGQSPRPEYIAERSNIQAL